MLKTIPSVKARLRRLIELPRTFPRRAKHEVGLCSVCGETSRFLANSENLKESLHCVHCHAWTRIRMMADLLTQQYSSGVADSLAQLVEEPRFRDLRIFEAQASGPLNLLLRRCPNYTCSEYIPNVPSGEFFNGVRSEDLQSLSFADKSLDLILHSSVLEHVPVPTLALRESWRVLADGGLLLFEVPMTDRNVEGVRKATRTRARLEQGKVVHILEPNFHDDPLCKEGILVFTDHGQDLLDDLEGIGFEAELKILHLPGSSMSHSVIVRARKPA